MTSEYLVNGYYVSRHIHIHINANRLVWYFLNKMSVVIYSFRFILDFVAAAASQLASYSEIYYISLCKQLMLSTDEIGCMLNAQAFSFHDIKEYALHIYLQIVRLNQFFVAAFIFFLKKKR